MVDARHVGKKIAYLRKKIGFTQNDIASRLGISDKAVSKWERGLSIPDVGYLNRLAILLNTNVESLISEGDFFEKKSWLGIVDINKRTQEVDLTTVIYDKPLVYYILGYFLLFGIKDIVIFCTNKEKIFIKECFGNGNDYGMRITYAIDYSEECLMVYDEKIKNALVVFEKSFLYGVDLTRFFQRAANHEGSSCLLAFPKHKDSVLKENERINNFMEHKKKDYDYCFLPFLFCPLKSLKKHVGNSDITTDVEKAICDGKFVLEPLDRGFIEIAINTIDDVCEASELVRIIQQRCGMIIYCVEEIAWRRGIISLEQMKKLSIKYNGTKYGDYIQHVYERNCKVK